MATYSTAITTVTLVVLTIPSEIVILEPIEVVEKVSRGDSLFIEVQLNDLTYSTPIGDSGVLNESDQLQVYVQFEGVRYYMQYFSFSSTWNLTLPGSATILEALLAYPVQIFATFLNYDPAVNQFSIHIKQTDTELEVLGPGDPTQLEVYYLQNVTIQLNFTYMVNDTVYLIDDGDVYWRDATRGIDLYFNSLGGGLWTLTFNTTILGFGTVGVTFHAEPTNTTLADRITSITLTVKKIPTSIVGPTEDIVLEWGWTGAITLDFLDDYNDRPVSGAEVTYTYGNLDFNATDLGNGTYVLNIDTTLLASAIREKITCSFVLPNYEERPFSFYIRVNERPTELIVSYSEQYYVSSVEGVMTLQLTMGDSIDLSLFYNDTSPIGGLFGGITNANFTEFTELRAPSYFSGSRPILFLEGFGFYNFTFDTNDLSLYGLDFTGPVILEEQYFRFTIEIFDEHRTMQTIEIRIRIITTPTEILFEGEPVDPESDIVYTLINGEEIVFDFYLSDTWHDSGVDGAIFYITSGATAIISSNSSLGNGHYTIIIKAVGYGGDSVIDVTLSREFHEDVAMGFLIHTEMNDFDELVFNMTRYGLPISIFIIVLLGAYVRVWSVPKRIRQINGQLKTLRKGKIPKPIGDVKSRQQLTAELFNDTYEEMKITRTAAEMPEDAIPIEVPEMGELLTQLAILTNLSAEELDEFQADIVKMKMSEQAAFVKEVIMQEAIRAARHDGRTVEETLAAVEQEAHRRLGGEEDVEAVEVVDAEPEETVFLEEEKKVTVTPDEEVTPVEEDEFEEVTEVTSEKMSLHEIEELRRELERKGVPPHEIITIIEQAKELPRELVEELVKSLEGKKD
jgi:hypothetical protein